MTDDVLNRSPVHALLADGTTVCIRPAAPGDHGQLEGIYGEMFLEILQLRFSSTSRRSRTAAAAARTMTRQALFTRAGIAPTHSVGELLETASRPVAARRGRRQPGPSGTGSGHRARRRHTPAAASAPQPLSAPPALRRKSHETRQGRHRHDD
ncbi:hypothetical protein GCM10023335_45100 [Streptomyces siamensis]|uniref:Acetyltransferase n=1 Tax=Streptomyces siamensis TaxID=1274986 RepID=A0ABP9J434_9ACTN